MLYFVNSVLFEDSEFNINYILNINHQDDYVSQIKYGTKYLKEPYSDLTFIDIEQFDKEVNITNYDIFIINMPYECIKQYYNLNKNFKIINFVIHPDIDYIQNTYLSDNSDIYDNIVKCLKDDTLNKLIDTYKYDDFDIKLNYISFNTLEFNIYQDYLKNFYIYKFVKMPNFYKLAINKNDKNISIKGSDCFNIYDYFNYQPLTFEQLRELEGQTVEVSELINLNKK